MKILINEIFTSIQGESSWAGFPFFFIRTTGCNLRCKYCDTTYAYKNGKYYEIDEIVNLAKKSNLDKVLITGGEPLIQDSVYTLIDSLINENFKVLIETNGSILINKVNNKAIKIIDIKTPSSGESKKNKYENIFFLNKDDEIKFVISNLNDFKWALKIIEKYNIQEKINNILFSPVYKNLSPKKLGEWIIQFGLNFARLQIQLHKYIGLK